MDKVYRIESNGFEYRIKANPESRVGGKLGQGVPYEHKLLTYIAACDYKGVAIDVGAHIGNHALYLASVCRLKVHAFEPVFTRELLANLALNPNANVTPYTLALGDTKGWVKPLGFGSQRAPSGWGEIEMRPCSPGESGAVPVEPLDAFHIQDVALIKLDVEGMEPAVLRGAIETIKRWHPDVYVEARDREAHDAIASVLTPLGYRHALTANTSTPVEKWTPSS